LPQGTPHGIAIAAMVRMHRPIPVLFLADYPDHLEHVPPGATVLIKPVPDDDLVAAVTTCLNS
jgi:hypothetical protein